MLKPVALPATFLFLLLAMFLVFYGQGLTEDNFRLMLRIIGAYSKHYQGVLLDSPGAKKWFLSHWELTQSTVKLLRLHVK